MMPHKLTAAPASRRIVPAFSLFLAVALQAQTAPATDPATLAQSDKNKNGVLDPDEIARKLTDEVRHGNATVTLTPFEVSTAKDVGYAAGNTLSGGRGDNPLALTPGSISVMTKEFLDDFNITDINQAARIDHRHGWRHLDAQLRFFNASDLPGDLPRRAVRPEFPHAQWQPEFRRRRQL